VAYTQLGKLGEAGGHFAKAVALNPHSAEARNNLGANHLALKNYRNAAAEFERALQISPANVSAWFNLGTSRLHLGQSATAASAFEKAAALAPGDAQILVALAEARFKAGASPGALEVVRQLAGSSTTDLPLLLSLGVLLQRNGQAEEAARYFLNALERDSSVSERMMTLAASSINQGDYATSLALLTSLRGVMEPSAAWHGMLGYTHFKLDHIEPALMHLQRAIHLDPTNEDYYLNLGELLGENQALLPNVAVFESGVKRLPDSVKIRLALAVAHLLTGNLDRAKQELDTVLAREPGSEVAYKVLLECYEKGREWDKMQVSATDLRRLHPGNPLGWYYGAFAEYEAALPAQAGFEQARRWIRKALELSHSEWRFHFLLGKIFLAEQRVPDAIGAFEATIHLHSEHPQPFYHLAKALQRQGRREEAVMMMARYQEVKARMEARQSRGLLVETR
jgi:tetratricopeptide (TPR) repeat protein